MARVDAAIARRGGGGKGYLGVEPATVDCLY